MTVLAHLGGDLSGASQALLVAGALLSVAWVDRTGRAAGVLSPRRRLALWLAAATGLVATAGPLDAAAHRSFAAHMVQHLVLLVVVAPAIVAARPDLVLLRALPSGARRRTALGTRRVAPHWPAGPALAGLALAAWLWVAHVPAVYAAQLASPVVHILEHAVWVVVGIGFWAPLLRQRRSTARRVLTPIVELVALLPASSILALVLLGGSSPRFAHYADLASALGDQRLGAGLMAGAMTVVLLGASLVVIGTSEPRHGSSGGPRYDEPSCTPVGSARGR